jgi:adenylate cyclase
MSHNLLVTAGVPEWNTLVDEPSPARRSRACHSLVFKWSLTMALLLALGIGLCGWIAIAQQRSVFLGQMDTFGHILAIQLAGAAAEPLLADDNLALKVLLHQSLTTHNVLGAEVLGQRRAPLGEGLRPVAVAKRLSASPQSWKWRDTAGKRHRARSYVAPVHFAGRLAGLAVITLDADALRQVLRRALVSIALVTLLLIPSAVTLGVLLARRLSRPLSTLVSVSGSLEPGQSMCLPGAVKVKEIEHIVQVLNRLATRVQERQRVEDLFRRYVSRPLPQNLLRASSEAMLRPHLVEASVLFCDVTGFTALSEPLSPECVVDLLNEYFRYFITAAHKSGGVVDSFSGDCVMVVFGTVESDLDHALHAATCALLMRDMVQRINSCRDASQLPTVRFRIGVNSGPMARCHLGDTERLHPTVIGDTVNVAARLCGLGSPGEVTLGAATAEDPKVAKHLQLTPRPLQAVRGRRAPVASYRAEGGLGWPQCHQLLQALDGILPRHA